MSFLTFRKSHRAVALWLGPLYFYVIIGQTGLSHFHFEFQWQDKG